MNRRRAVERGAMLGFVGAAAGLAVALSAGVAQANPMDLAPERLVLPCSAKTASDGTVIACGQEIAGKGSNYFHADNAAWAKLLSQYAVAIAPVPMHGARTTGYGGFELSLFGNLTTVSSDADWMKRGTEGALSGTPPMAKFPKSNESPDPVLQVYGVVGRKGLPYGFELQGSIGYVANTELVVLGGGIRWSLFEGFRKGAPGAIPDISIGGYVNTLTGTAKVKLTVPSLDVQLSKPFTVASQVIIQPYIGWQMLWLLADSAVVDLTPGVDGLNNCYSRPSTPAERAADNGEFRCQQKTGSTLTDSTDQSAKLDLNNNAVFSNIRFRRQRAMLGVAIRYEVAHLLIHAATDVIDPVDGVPEKDRARVDGLARQWTFGAVAGISW